MKPSAHLTSRLLARKGEAAPVASFPAPAPAPDKREKNTFWGNINAAKSVKTSAPVKMPELDRTAINCKMKAEAEPEGRVAMTLRLDAEQHKRLRLLSVHSHQSAREIMTAALDIYLDLLESKLDISNCKCLNQIK